MATNPVHIIATPVGVNFVKAGHNPTDDADLNGSYGTLSEITTSGAGQHAAKDLPSLTLNDRVYAARIESGDL